MARSTAKISWKRGHQPFVDLRYSRRHVWRFDGGIDVPASSSPEIVPVPQSAVDAVDPEEAFVASLSSCHMLWFLSLAAGAGWIVERYDDEATGVLGPLPDGRLAMLTVELHPHVTFAGSAVPLRTEINDLHEEAHRRCFLANSVRTEVHCLPRYD